VNPLPCLRRSGFAQAGTRGEENILLFSNENDLVKSLKTVTPAEAGVQNYLNLLDSRFRGNDKIGGITTSYETANE
jgi:hypothetical protein